MKCPNPTNQTFNNLNNFIDMTEYTKICNDFNIDPNSDFRLKLEINKGAGYLYDEIIKNFSKNLTQIIFHLNIQQVIKVLVFGVLLHTKLGH